MTPRSILVSDVHVTILEVERELRALIGDTDPTTKKGRRRTEILDVATPMFAAQGYRDTSMDQIAAALGIAKGTLYLYYPQKLDLLFACASREKLAWVSIMFDIVSGSGQAADRLKRYINAILLLPSRSPLMCRLLDGDADLKVIMAGFPQGSLRRAEAMRTELLQPLLDELAGPEHRWNAVELNDRAAVISSIAFFAPLVQHEWVRGGMSPERFAAIVADFIVDGIRPSSSKGTSP